MQTLRAEDLTKTYGEKTMFKDLNFIIKEHDRIGLIGVNGSGKSSLLNALDGLDEDTTGKIETPKSYSIGYLKQHPVLDDHFTILDAIFSGNQKIFKTIRHYEQVLDRYSKHPEDQKVLDQYTKAEDQMNKEDAWDAENNVKTILTQLKIKDMNQKVGTLSGGQKRRVGLAQVLIESPDLLLLDEPTNHLDFSSVDWLEDYLANYKGALIVVTHDRYFLDHVSNNIWELSFGKLYFYQGNYHDYVRENKERVRRAVTGEHKEEQKYKKELAWMHQGIQGRGTRQNFKVAQFKDTQSKVHQLKLHKKVDITLSQKRLGKKVIKLKHASLTLGTHKIMNDFSYLIQGGDRIGITGANGAGKSTFLNVLAQKKKLDSGIISVGPTVKIGYYTQQTEPIPGDKRVINYLQEIAHSVTDKEGNRISVTQLLEEFLFPRFMHGTLIRKLSGGEKRRLYLLKILMQKPNVLLLDEPTNDLDISTLTVLENYIKHFDGTVITVSHDRYFLDQVADRLLIFDGQGHIEQHVGRFTTWLNQKLHPKKNHAKGNQPTKTAEKKKKVAAKKAAVSAENQKPKKKLTYAEELEYTKLGQEIDQLDSKKMALEKQMALESQDYQKLADLQGQVNKISAEANQKMKRWLELGQYADHE